MLECVDMDYCPKCGGRTEGKGGDEFVCQNCGKTHFINPKSGVAIILYSSDKKNLILARRAHEPSVGKLDFIGGFLNVGENFEQAIYREMFEESGLRPQDIGKLIYATSIYNAYLWEGEILPTTSVCFMAELHTDVNLKAGDDVGMFDYVPIDSLPLNDQAAWDDMDRVLKDTAQLLATM